MSVSQRTDTEITMAWTAVMSAEVVSIILLTGALTMQALPDSHWLAIATLAGSTIACQSWAIGVCMDGYNRRLWSVISDRGDMPLLDEVDP